MRLPPYFYQPWLDQVKIRAWAGATVLQCTVKNVLSCGLGHFGNSIQSVGLVEVLWFSLYPSVFFCCCTIFVDLLLDALCQYLYKL